MSLFRASKTIATATLLLVSHTLVCNANEDLFAPAQQASDPMSTINAVYQQAAASSVGKVPDMAQQAAQQAQAAHRMQNERIQGEFQAQQLELQRQQAEAAQELADEKRIAAQKAHELEKKRLAEEKRFHNIILFIVGGLLLGLAFLIYWFAIRPRLAKNPTKSILASPTISSNTQSETGKLLPLQMLGKKTESRKPLDIMTTWYLRFWIFIFWPALPIAFTISELIPEDGFGLNSERFFFFFVFPALMIYGLSQYKKWALYLNLLAVFFLDGLAMKYVGLVGSLLIAPILTYPMLRIIWPSKPKDQTTQTS